MSAIELQGVTKTYGKHEAVQPLDLAIPSGKVTGLLGPNGAGKTTTLRMIMGILLPDTGVVKLLGEPYRPEVRRRIGYLPEERGLYPKMKVREQLDFLAGLRFVEPAVRRRRIDDWLERLELTDWKDKKVEELSKGMQQKVQFIATILHDPDLLIFDEPFTGLDPVNTKLLKDILLEFVRGGKTVVLSTHRMEQVEMLCEEICLINRGRKVVAGPIAQVKERYGHNMIQLELDGNGIALGELPGVEKVDDYGKYAEIRLTADADSQALFDALAGRARVRRFELTAPSVNDIFIELVGEDAASDDDGAPGGEG